MSWLESHYQEILTLGGVALAAGYLALKSFAGGDGSRAGASCGSCPANPECSADAETAGPKDCREEEVGGAG